MFDQEELKRVLDYDPETGLFTRTTIKVLEGSRASNDGVRIAILGKQILAHRVAWFYMTGKWPKAIEHKDKNNQNNRWDNLIELPYNTKKTKALHG